MRQELEVALEELEDTLVDTLAAFLRFQRLRMAHRAVEEILDGETHRRNNKEDQWADQKPVPD